MERLTYRRDADGRVCPNLKGGKDWLSHMKMVADKLCEYEDAEERGILLRLPCKVGDAVYRIEVGCCEYRANGACVVYCDGYDYTCPDYKADRHIVVGHFSLNDIASLGKTVFLTREEAEATLARRDSMGLEYYKKEVEAAFAQAALALSCEDYAELCEYLKENRVI